MNFLSSVLLFLSDHPWLFALAKGSLMLAVVGGVFAIALKLRLSAAARHGLLLVGCVVALVVPLLALAEVQGWRMQMADGPPVEVKQPVLPTSAELMRVAAEPMGVPAATRAVDFQLAEIKPQSSADAPSQSAPAAWHARLTFAQIVCIVWFLGVAAVLLPLAVAYTRLFWQTLRSRPVTCALWQQMLEQSVSRAGVRHRVRVCVLPQTDLIPGTFGVGRFTRIALPESALGWSETEMRLVLDHELAHVRRRDWLARLAGQLVLAVYWFHPLAWWMTKRMGVEAEFACDDRVVVGGASAPAYAECMLEMAGRMARGNRSGWVAPAMPFAAALPARIARVLEPTHPRHRMAKTWGLGLVLGASLAAGIVGCVRMERKPVDPVVRAALVQAKHKEQEGEMLTAAAMGHPFTLQRLLAEGIKVDMRDANGWQPLHWAAKGGRAEAVKVLIAAGAKASARLEGGETPASLADEGDHRELSVYLMERAAEDYSSVAMQNALLNAARDGDVASVRRLVAAGADVNAKDYQGQTAAQVAKKQGHVQLVAYLTQQSQKP